MLILKHRERTVVPGGGGNAIYNLAELGVYVLPVGLVGDDEPGRLSTLPSETHSDGRNLQGEGLHHRHQDPHPGGNDALSRQQVVRVDREPDGP